MWYLIGAVWIAVVAAVVWVYGRKSANRESERERRFREMISEARLVAAAIAANTIPPAVPSPAAGPATAAIPSGAAPPPPPAPTLLKRPRLLAQADALLYYVMRTGLPDHEVFASLTLADLVRLPAGQGGYDAVQKLRRLAQQRIDFVVCNRRLEIVAAVVMDRAGPTDAGQIEARRLIEETLQAVGIRLIRIDAARPPRHQQVRGLIYGERTA